MTAATHLANWAAFVNGAKDSAERTKRKARAFGYLYGSTGLPLAPAPQPRFTCTDVACAWIGDAPDRLNFGQTHCPKCGGPTAPNH